MKLNLLILVLCLLSQQSFAANSTERIRMLTEEYVDKCFYHPDYTYCADNTDPGVVAGLGGKTHYIERLKKLNREKSELEFIYTIIDIPGPAKQIGSSYISIVPIQNIVLSNNRLMHIDAYLMALSTDKGASWRYSDYNNNVIASVHPELSGKISPEMLTKHQHSDNENAMHRVGIDNIAEYLSGPQPEKGKIKDRRYTAEDGSFSVLLPFRFGWYRTVVTSEKKDANGFSIIFQSPDTTLRSYNLLVGKTVGDNAGSDGMDIIKQSFNKYISGLKHELNADVTIVYTDTLEKNAGISKHWKLEVVSRDIGDTLIFLIDITIAHIGNHITTVSSSYNPRNTIYSGQPTLEKVIKAEKQDMDGFLSTNAVSDSIIFH